LKAENSTAETCLDQVMAWSAAFDMNRCPVLIVDPDV
jgi:hypothetical protein